ncbi:MAG: hypothetical protein NXH88_03405 [Hyphomonas sp.]|nr:hypothetical protein [Hyphomonas sp.]
MTEGAPDALDFAALDGLAFAAERERLNGQAIPTFTAREIGPLFEFSQLSARGLLPAPQSASFLALDGLAPLIEAMENGTGQWVAPGAANMGFLRTRTTPPADPVWTGFGLAAQKAATASGFPRAIAAQLAAALGELHSNIYEHAQAPDTGVIAFRAEPGRFEFVVADHGIGVLESLRSAAAYTQLDDHGEALRLTLTDGVSRYGADTGRGHGFRPLFVGLANLNGALRFRSGDHALLIDGRNPSLMTARTAQKPAMQGFLIAVSCTTGRARPNKRTS